MRCLLLQNWNMKALLEYLPIHTLVGQIQCMQALLKPIHAYLLNLEMKSCTESSEKKKICWSSSSNCYPNFYHKQYVFLAAHLYRRKKTNVLYYLYKPVVEIPHSKTNVNLAFGGQSHSNTSTGLFPCCPGDDDRHAGLETEPVHKLNLKTGPCKVFTSAC